MLKNLVLTVISNDRPGIVEQLAETIRRHGGNWLESNMSQLAGKFAGILRVSVVPESQEELETALYQLKNQGIQVQLETIDNPDPLTSSDSKHPLRFNLTGADRPGIVHEVSRAFASTEVNVLELETRCSSMPWSGEPLFEAEGLITVPAHLTQIDVEYLLEPIATELGLDISLEPTH